MRSCGVTPKIAPEARKDFSISAGPIMKANKPPDDVFEGPGFGMVRRGRNLELKTHRSPEEQRELKKRMVQSRPKILAELQSKTAELLAIVHKYTSLDLVANLFLRDSLHNPDKYIESESKLRPHHVEHIAILELKDPHYQLRSPLLVEGADVERAHILLEEIFDQTVWYHLAEGADPNVAGPPSRMDELRFVTLLHGMSVRSPAYNSHWRDVLIGLFGHGGATQYLSSRHSLDVQTALAIIDAIENHILGTLQSRVEQARTSHQDILERLKNYMRTGAFVGEAHEKGLFDQVRNMGRKNAKRYLKFAHLEWTRVALGLVLSFTAERIAALSGVSVEHVQAFLNQVSVEFGSTPTDYVLPAPANILHERPVIHYESRYFCPAPHLLPWSIKPAFERVLSSKPTWNAYQKQRSSYLVNTALKHITKMLPGAIAYENLFYRFETGEEAEMDGLLLFDRYAFLIEGKAGSLGSARRGGKQGIKTQLEALVGKAVHQVVRAHNYVRNTDTPSFKLDNGGTVTLDKARYTDLVLMTVTLDVLDIFTAELHQMREIGVVTTSDLPWAVALSDLRAISEILYRPFEFTHYLRWRLSTIQDASLSGGKDELNWLAVYLKEGPKQPSVPADYTNLMFTSYTDDFDAYFLYQQGVRTVPAPRPAQPLPRPMDRLCDALISNGAHGFTEPGECLLDLNFEERRDFAQKLVKLAFDESKGRASEFVLQITSLVVKVLARNLSRTELDVEADSLQDLKGRRGLVIALTTLPDWQVYGWNIRIPHWSSLS